MILGISLSSSAEAPSVIPPGGPVLLLQQRQRQGYGTWYVESQLRRVDDQIEEKRRLSEKRMAELAAKRKEIVRNQTNAAKLSNLLAQLKGVQQDLNDSSDEMDESTPPSSSTVPSSNFEIEVKN